MTETLNKEKEEIDGISKELKKFQYSFSVPVPLFDKIQKHITVLKHTEDINQNKQRWLLNAIKKKLSREGGFESFSIPRNKNISVSLDEKTNEELNSLVNMVKKVRRTYSRKSWMVDAISEQLDREQLKVNDFFNKAP